MKNYLIGIVSLAVTTATLVFASDVYVLRSLNYKWETRSVYLTLKDERYRYKKCDCRETQVFELVNVSGSDFFTISQAGKCLVSSSNNLGNASIESIDCSSAHTDRRQPVWGLSRGPNDEKGSL